MCSPLELLDIRLKLLEDRVFGSKKTISGKLLESNVVEMIAQIENKLKELTTGKERFNYCYQTVQQLDKWLDIEYVERIAATDSSKYEEVIAREDEIREEANMFEKISALEKNIDSTHIRDYHQLEPKLSDIRLIAIDQFEQSTKIDEQCKQLLLSYNEWITIIKQQLLEWDQKIKEFESRTKKDKRNINLDID